uniref:Uncharacterized protein n=1 Tax=Glossina pallidipes TaxID=7398 RepID=A0A1A9ZBV4_GLOPL
MQILDDQRHILMKIVIGYHQYLALSCNEVIRGFCQLRIPTCTLLAVHVSQIISLPSKEPVTQCLESPAKCTEFTLFI